MTTPQIPGEAEQPDWITEGLIAFYDDLSGSKETVRNYLESHQLEFGRAKAGIEAKIAANYVPKGDVTDAFKCEYGHPVYSHKTVDGYCCACDADIAFMDKKYTESEIQERERQARLDENNMAFLRIFQIARTKGLTAEALLSYHDVREKELVAQKAKEV